MEGEKRKEGRKKNLSKWAIEWCWTNEEGCFSLPSSHGQSSRVSLLTLPQCVFLIQPPILQFRNWVRVEGFSNMANY